MERSEPTLIPEWLRCSGSVSGGGNSAHHFPSHPGVLSSAHSSRNKCSRSTSDKDYHRSTLLERSSSSNFRRSTGSNGSPKHPYSSFTRSHRDKNRDKEKERSVGDFWDHESSDPLILISRDEKDTLRRSRSLVYRKPGEVYPQRAVNSSNGGNNSHNTTNGVLSRGVLTSSIQKTSFEKDFPSLGTGEKQGTQDVGRVPSPGLSSAVQCLPIGNNGLIGGEGWTSALAEVPTIIGCNSMGPTSVQQSVPATPSIVVSTPMAGLNMAEALSQAPSRARTTPQLPDKTQRLEELALKQSRQLIPMMPSAPKGLVSNSDKLKPKTVARTSEAVVAAKIVQQQQQQQQPSSSHVATHSLRGGQVKPDAQRSTQTGKFHVLKPLRENGVSSVANDSSSPTNNGSKLGSNQLIPAPVAPSTPLKSPRSTKVSAIEQKVAAMALNSASAVEKKHSLAQARSRSDFFNLMRMKGSRSTSVGVQDSGATISSSPSTEKSGEVIKEESAPVSPPVTDDSSGLTSNGDVHEEDKNLCLNGSLYPDEEEAAFLRSLGWEENGGEDDGLTEEEINAFYEEYMKLRPTLKLCKGVQTKLPMLSESHTTGSSRASSELSLSESEIEA